MTHDEAHDELQYWTAYKQQYAHMSAKSHATVDDRILHLQHTLSTLTTTVTHTTLTDHRDVIHGWAIVTIVCVIVIVLSAL